MFDREPNFGWDLPPGVSVNGIDEQVGADEEGDEEEEAPVTKSPEAASNAPIPQKLLLHVRRGRKGKVQQQMIGKRGGISWGIVANVTGSTADLATVYLLPGHYRFIMRGQKNVEFEVNG